ncbi:2188_t:CDS:2 [Entrophospora sp. SA101]|nr:2188_t:CDS:2 [Entrophospora sp. SA101]
MNLEKRMMILRPKLSRSRPILQKLKQALEKYKGRFTNLEQRDKMTSLIAKFDDDIKEIRQPSARNSKERISGASMCTDKILKKIGGKITRRITLEDKDSKFFNEMTTHPLGWAWFCTKEYDEVKLPTYLLEIVTNAEDAWVRTTLRIKNYEEKGSRVIVSVNKISESDSFDSDSSNSSSSSSDSENGEVYTITKRKCRCVEKKED